MMINKRLWTIALVLLSATDVIAASITFTGPTDADIGESFQVQLTGAFSAEGLVAGGITVSWDTALVQLDSVSFNLPVLSTLSCPGSSNCPGLAATNAPIVWGEFLADLISSGAGPTVLATLDFTAVGLGTVNFDMADVPELTGGWFGAGFSSMSPPTFSPFSMAINDIDTDGDGILNAEDQDDDNDGVNDVDEVAAMTDSLDPDTDNDGIGDFLDVELGNPPNFCLGGTVLVFSEPTISGPLTCAATTSITVSPLSPSLVQVLSDGDLHLIAPVVIFDNDFSVLGSESLGYGSLIVIPTDPCPACSP